MFYEVIPTQRYRSNGGALTYRSDLALKPGHIVQIPLGQRLVIGVVEKKVAKVDFPTKNIVRLLHPLPIPAHLLSSMRWLANYYLTDLTEVVGLLVPAGIEARTALKNSVFAPNGTEKPSSAKKPQSISPPRLDKKNPTQSLQKAQNSSKTAPAELKLPLIPLNPAQKTALEALQVAPGATKLLRGVTGSGKTNIYLKLASEALNAQKSAILLVPEIALTGQLVRIFKQTFGERVLVVHSRQTMAERREIWLKILESTSTYPLKPEQTERSGQKPEHLGEPLVVIGPRSALLTPVGNLGVILIDEAHEGAYFQENPPRYSALRLASVLAAKLKISCILGSATPNITDYYLAGQKKSLVELAEKAKTSAKEPEISIVDLKDRANFAKNRYFSNILLTKISKNLEKGYQTLIFHNRRGSAPLTICEDCGWQALCPECYLPMTLHTDDYRLCCHLCGHEEPVPKNCPNCGKVGIIHKGFGTKLLESELARLFPETRIARFDGDNKKTESLAGLYDEVKSGEIKLLIGTQTLARGLDLPKLATVGVVQADAGLALPDFAVEERAFELLTQVVGRVGRGHLDTAEVVMQTYQPDHPVIRAALKADYPEFAKYLLHERRRQNLPPFTYLAKLSVTYKTEKTATAKIQAAHQELSKNPEISLSPPMPAFHERADKGFTWQIMLKSTKRQALVEALRPYLAQAKFSVTIDPVSLL